VTTDLYHDLRADLRQLSLLQSDTEVTVQAAYSEDCWLLCDRLAERNKYTCSNFRNGAIYRIFVRLKQVGTRLFSGNEPSLHSCVCGFRFTNQAYFEPKVPPEQCLKKDRFQSVR
jgi:hypothetical protein